MDNLIASHKKQQRDLQSQITQKKKAASKKSRKAVNDECAKLEEDMKARQAQEVAASSNESNLLKHNGEREERQHADNDVLAVIDSGASSLDRKVQKLEVTDNASQPESNDDEPSKQKKPNRQKARLARRAAEQEAQAAAAAKEAAAMPDTKKKERNRMAEEILKHKLVEMPVAANGHCLYLAVADQLKQLKVDLRPESVAGLKDGDASHPEEDYRLVRIAAADYISKHSDDFVPFLEKPLDEYIREVRDTGIWGGQIELLALAKTYNVTFNVLQADGRPEKISSGDENDEQPEAWLAYYRHGFGLGEHYNSLHTLSK